MDQKLNRRTRLILKRLEKLQNADGSWADNSFINALVAYSLSSMDAPPSMIETSLRFILSQKNDGWSWNYYIRGKSKKHTIIKKNPDDLDDTFCSLIAIYSIKPEIISLTARATIRRLLRDARDVKKGAYCTWVRKIWDDTDPIVNANISFFATLAGEEFPEVTEYIDRCLGSRPLCSKYYHNPFLAYYFISRNYRGSKKALLMRDIRLLLKNKNSAEKEISATNAALALCALLRLGSRSADVSPLVALLCRRLTQKSFAKTEAEHLYIEKIVNGQTYHGQSHAFDLAICGEAISLYMETRQKEKEEEIFELIRKKAEIRFKCMPKSLRTMVKIAVERTLKNDKRNVVTLLPHRILISLKKSTVSEKTSVSCGLISLFGWIAYSAYDHIIDGHKGACRLPVANVFLREMSLLCFEIAGQKYISICRKILDAIDCAELLEYGYRENTHARGDGSIRKILPKRQMIDKSIGFALPSVLALVHSGIKPDGPAMKNFILFFRHYLFVRQMSDDIRDWRQDMEHGMRTRVTGRIKRENKQPRRKRSDAAAAAAALEISAREMMRHSKQAKRALELSGIFSKNSYIFSLVDHYDCTARNFISGRNVGLNSKIFIQ